MTNLISMMLLTALGYSVGYFLEPQHEIIGAIIGFVTWLCTVTGSTDGVSDVIDVIDFGSGDGSVD